MFAAEKMIFLLGLIAVTIINSPLQVSAEITVTANSALLEEELAAQIIVFEEDGERRLHWLGVPDTVEESDYCTLAAGGDQPHTALAYTLLRNVQFTFKTDQQQFNVTALPCKRDANNEMMYLARASLSTCAFVFVPSGHSYMLDRKVCGLPAV